MRLVESLKHGQEKIESMNAGLRKSMESTFRHWPEVINKRITDMRSLSLPWSPSWHFFDFSANDEAVNLSDCAGLKAVYERLSPTLGEETFVGEWYTLTQETINAFATVTEDQQWIHTDPERAATESPFKSTIAHGFLTLSLIPKLTNNINPDKTDYPEARMIVNVGLNKVMFLTPVKTGKRLRASTRIIKLVPLKRGLEIVREVRVQVENSHRPACLAEMVIRLYF